MSHPVRRFALLAGVAAALLAGAVGVRAQQANDAGAPGRVPVIVPSAPVPPPPAGSSDLVRRGEYLTLAADCMPCHTRPGGTPFAGGLVMNTPFGRIASPNITQDTATGLGQWSEHDFWNVLHNGVGRGLGHNIYPVMTYTSYTKLTRDDVHAIWAYMRTVKGVDAPRLPVSLPFPFSIRPSLIGWNMLFFDRGVFRPDPHQTAQWNRGAYLVEGAGHCGECHTPRNALGGTIDGRSLAGGVADGYLAPNISSDRQFGLGTWSEDEIVAFLKHGDNSRNVVFGPMSDVVHASMAFMSDDDLHAIAFYLKASPPRHETLIDPIRLARASVARGAALYATNCAQCHQASGHGVGTSIPSLVANGAVIQRTGNDVIMPVLIGQSGQGSYGAMPAFGGALDDGEIADLVNYVRTTWGNTTDASVRPGDVRALRDDAPTGLGGSGAARGLGCAPIGDSTVPNTVATEDEVTIASWIENGGGANAVASLAARAKADNPDATAADVSRVVTAAYCPVVASQHWLTPEQQRAKLRTFGGDAGRAVAALFPPQGSAVVVSAAVPAATASALAEAAGSAHQSVGAYVASTLNKNAK